MTQLKRETLAHHTMALIGGFFGLYALFTRGGTFGASETSNLIYLLVSGLTGSVEDFLIRLGGTGCYIAGIVFASLGKRYCRRVDFRYFALAVDAGACVLLALIPAEIDPVLSLYPMFFATAVQWLAYTQAAGFSSATIFSTNNLRQCMEGLTGYCCTRSEADLRRFWFFGGTLVFFHVGAAYGWKALELWGARSIFACLPLVGLGALATLWENRGRVACGDSGRVGG